jgi:hypothetical protein
MITKRPPKTPEVLTPEVLYAKLEVSPFAYDLRRIMEKFYRRALAHDTAIPSCVWGLACEIWSHPNFGNMFDVMIGVEYSGDKFNCRWLCNNRRKGFTVDARGELVATPQAQEDWRSVQRYLWALRNQQAIVMFADGPPIFQGCRRRCVAA